MYLDEIETKKAHKYFEKFVKRWNAGKLDGEFKVYFGF